LHALNCLYLFMEETYWSFTWLFLNAWCT